MELVYQGSLRFVKQLHNPIQIGLYNNNCKNVSIW